MRSIILATTAVLAIGLVTPTPSDAQTQQKVSTQQAFNACVDLARQRGWTESDLEINRREVRNFVARCIQGRQARAGSPARQDRVGRRESVVQRARQDPPACRARQARRVKPDQ